MNFKSVLWFILNSCLAGMLVLQDMYYDPWDFFLKIVCFLLILPNSPLKTQAPPDIFHVPSQILSRFTLRGALNFVGEAK